LGSAKFFELILGSATSKRLKNTGVEKQSKKDRETNKERQRSKERKINKTEKQRKKDKVRNRHEECRRWNLHLNLFVVNLINLTD
jgi:hypothetical protein